MSPDRPDQPRETGTETAAQRRKRLADVFGDPMPDTTSDEREPESGRSREDAGERWLREQVPPHHG